MLAKVLSAIKQLMDRAYYIFIGKPKPKEIEPAIIFLSKNTKVPPVNKYQHLIDKYKHLIKDKH